MKILCVYASAGAGHMKAAQAIYHGIHKHTDYHVVYVDALDYTSPVFKLLYRGTYTFAISKVPALWAACFDLINIPFLQPLVRFGRRIYNGLNSFKLQKFLMDEQFDYIVSCHFMSTEVTAAMIRSHKITSKLITVVTDYDVHRIWLAKGVHKYAVACAYTCKSIQTMGIKAEDVVVTGIPADEKFTNHPDISELKEKLGFDKNKFTVLIATGSFGFGPIEEIAEQLEGFQVLVVSGHNKGLYHRLKEKNLEHIKILGLVNNMHELMAVSDVMVTKPGGLSITEAMVSQLPMIFFSPIPGQETNNIKVLKEQGIGMSGCTTSQIIEKLRELKNSPDLYKTHLKRTGDIANPNAVKDIIGLLKSKV